MVSPLGLCLWPCLPGALRLPAFPIARPSDSFLRPAKGPWWPVFLIHREEPVAGEVLRALGVAAVLEDRQ